MRLTSEPEARGSAATGRRRPVGLIRASERAGDDLLAFVEIAAHDLRGRAVRDAEPHGHRLGLAVGADDPHATGRRAATAALTASLAFAATALTSTTAARRRHLGGLTGGTDPQRRIGDLQYVGLLGDDQFHVGGHSRKELALGVRSEEHTSELQSLTNLVCRLLLE